MSNLPFLAAGFPLDASLKAIPTSTGIYAIHCKVNDFVYFGSTGRSFRLRAMEHVKQLRNGTHHSLTLQAHWHSKGASSFEFHIVELCLDKETLVYEQRYIDLRGIGYKNKSYNLEAIAFNNSRNGSEEESLVGKKFGKLTVLEFAGRVGKGRRSWRCACDCGGEKTTTTSQLRRVNGTHSCGCLRRESRITHGLGKRHRAEIRAKVDHMGVKALHRQAFAVRLKTGLIWLISCRIRRSATVECGFQATNEEQIRWRTSCFPVVHSPEVVQPCTMQSFQRSRLKTKRLECLFSLRFKAI